MRHLFFIYTFCLAFLCSACQEDKSVDPTIMPEATEVGANTFGCLVDGWVYTGGRWGLPVAEYTLAADSSSMTVSAQVGLSSRFDFAVAHPGEGKTLPCVYMRFDNREIEGGNVRITRMSDGIFSGTFEGKDVAEGRFDLQYTDPQGKFE